MKTLRYLHNLLNMGGIDVLRLMRSIAGVPNFCRDAWEYRRSARNGHMPLRLAFLKPMLADRFEAAGSASGHYFFQDLWAARKIFAVRPSRHVDVGSRIDGFVSHLLTFMPVEVLDVRPLSSSIAGLTFLQEDATELNRIADGSLPSVSSLHAVEHFGLGRYGDPVNPSAAALAMKNLARVLAPGGRLYFAVPVGVERVEFNAHRVFDPRTVLREFQTLDLVSFSIVDDAGNYLEGVDPAKYSGARFSCGLFEFTRAGQQTT